MGVLPVLNPHDRYPAYLSGNTETEVACQMRVASSALLKLIRGHSHVCMTPPSPQRITHRPDLIIRKLDILQVKRAIGAALIEENIGLFAEADAYSEILGDVQLDTEALLVRRQLCSTPQRTLVRRSCILV